MALKVSNKNRKKTQVFECTFPSDKEKLGKGTEVTELPDGKRVYSVDVGEMDYDEAQEIIAEYMFNLTGKKVKKTSSLEIFLMCLTAVVIFGSLLFII